MDHQQHAVIVSVGLGMFVIGLAFGYILRGCDRRSDTASQQLMDRNATLEVDSRRLRAALDKAVGGEYSGQTFLLLFDYNEQLGKENANLRAELARAEKNRGEFAVAAITDSGAEPQPTVAPSGAPLTAPPTSGGDDGVFIGGVLGERLPTREPDEVAHLRHEAAHYEGCAR